MQSIPIIEPIQQLFEQHHIPYTMEQDWLIPYHDFARYPAIRALWFPYEVNGCLQIEVFHHDSTLMIECFAGVGVGDAAIADAMQNFCLNSFHVFAVAFWDLPQDDQVTIEQWEIQGITYQVYLGAMGTRLMSADEFPTLPEHWFNHYSAEIQKESNLDTLAWFRLFVGNNQGKLTIEVLRNNDIWEEAQNAMHQLDWVQTEGYYSIRQFLILVENKRS